MKANVKSALVTVWQSAGLVIGRFEVRISVGATLHQGSTQPSIPPGSVNEYQMRLGKAGVAHSACG